MHSSGIPNPTLLFGGIGAYKAKLHRSVCCQHVKSSFLLYWRRRQDTVLSSTQVAGSIAAVIPKKT